MKKRLFSLEHDESVSPDLGTCYVQFKVHEMSIAGFVQFAVDSNCGQERIFGIEGPRNKRAICITSKILIKKKVL